MSVDDLGQRLEGELEPNELDVTVVELDLRHCLQHVAAPAGFTDRVMARVAERDAARTERGVRAKRSTSTAGFGGVYRQAGWWTAIAATLVLAVGGDVMHLRHQRQEREAAKVQEQMDLALQLTSHALDEVGGGLERSHASRYTQMVYEISK
jgi:hypothetical protein